MSIILSNGVATPPYVIEQKTTMDFARQFFQKDFHDIERLLRIFQNGRIKQRYFAAPLDWFQTSHTFSEKNDLYCRMALDLSIEAINACLTNHDYLRGPVTPDQIDAIIFVSTTGLATPSMDARIMNAMPFGSHTKRIPIWGLGCAGGTAGLARAHEYCQAFPHAAVLVVSVELCSLTFQHQDRSKSNLIGVSLFADGAACSLIVGEESSLCEQTHRGIVPKIITSESTLLHDAEDVMGWEIKDDGLYVVFSKSIPNLVAQWLQPVVSTFLHKWERSIDEVQHMIAHPGGRKVLEAYESSLKVERYKLESAWDVLQHYGNMSSPTVLYVLDRVMKKEHQRKECGLALSLGPGFSAELLLMEWEAVP
ncbi:putative chalcone synthase [Pullulanibacillus camelliae]|uniref:Putative chalcone synthase n=1 Tax=Pullulanibacillus camelliae TaxID=1707096 RepID=A0A8J2YBS3_9BACL|nr:3-oxoacyl-[acyl-carrier-protein] synthase III C-terminal domain-containing protein [Pullulanibacillus camelliae]GGE34330.1 putative chalcone synthase [Pullulanibacillus camelliae]